MQIQGLKFQLEAQIYSPVIQVQVDVARLRSILTRGGLCSEEWLKNLFCSGLNFIFSAGVLQSTFGCIVKNKKCSQQGCSTTPVSQCAVV